MTKGETYSLTAGSFSESITLTDNLYSTLSGGMQGSFGGGGPRGEMNENAGGGMKGGMNGDFGGEMRGGAPSGKMLGGQKHGERPDDITGATQLAGDEAV
jgi:hypothetical protein